MADKPGFMGTMANNKPVGSAGQPFGKMKADNPRQNAIARRLAAKKGKK